MFKQKIAKPTFTVIVALILAMLVFVFTGCNETTIKANKAMDSVVSMWEQVNADAKTTVESQNIALKSLATDAKDLTLQDGLKSDATGVGQLLCLSYLSTSLYVAQTLSASSDYKLGQVFSGDSVISQETVDSSNYLTGAAGLHLSIQAGIININRNVISGEINFRALGSEENAQEFSFYVEFQATVNAKTYDVSAFRFACYDNNAQSAGLNVWYYTGVTYKNMRGCYINVSTTEVQAEKDFADTLKTRGTTLFGKTATKEIEFSTETNKGLKVGDELLKQILN